jgi:hypothetical protein
MNAFVFPVGASGFRPHPFKVAMNTNPAHNTMATMAQRRGSRNERIGGRLVCILQFFQFGQETQAPVIALSL